MTYDGIDLAWHSLLRELLQQTMIPSRDGACRELRNVTIVLEGAREQFLHNKRRKLSPSYAAAEVLWYLSGSKKGELIAAYAPQYERFLDEKKEAHGAYGYRVFKQYGSLMHCILEMLRKSPLSRQAVIPIYQPTDVLPALSGDCPDIPCTLTWQFLVRNGQLHMTVNMRSNDVWLGLPYDAFAFTTIQKMTAAALNLQVGEYVHQACSMHLYERNEEAANEAAQLELVREAIPALPTNHYAANNADVAAALRAEESIRKGYSPLPLRNNIMADLVICCARKFDKLSDAQVVSPALRKALG